MRKLARRCLLAGGIVLSVSLFSFAWFRSQTYVEAPEEVFASVPPLEISMPTNDTPKILSCIESVYYPPDVLVLEAGVRNSSEPDALRTLIHSHPAEMETLRREQASVMGLAYRLLTYDEIFGPEVDDPLTDGAVGEFASSWGIKFPLVDRLTRLQILLSEDALSRGDRGELVRAMDMLAMLYRWRRHVLGEMSLLLNVQSSNLLLNYLECKAQRGELTADELSRILSILENAPDPKSVTNRVRVYELRLAINHTVLLFWHRSYWLEYQGRYACTRLAYFYNPSYMVHEILEHYRAMSGLADEGKWEEARAYWENARKQLHSTWPIQTFPARCAVDLAISGTLSANLLYPKPDESKYLTFFKAAAEGKPFPEPDAK